MPGELSVLRVFLSHRAALVDYAAPIVGCRASAEDVVQEAFIRFERAAGQGGGAGTIHHPVGYLYRIVRNLAIDWSRRQAQEGERTDAAIVDLLPTQVPSAEQTLLYRDELRVLAEALADLPERTRKAFDMHRIEGRTLQEVADHLGVSVVRAHQLVKDAVLRGARALAEHDEPGDGTVPDGPGAEED